MRSFFSALSFLTVIPIPSRLHSRKENAMFAAYPLVGFLIGGLLSLLYFAARLAFPDALAVVTLLAGSLLLTGAIHLDGLADCADAFYGNRDREETLRILKDPRIGTMGGTAIGLSLLARFAAVSAVGASAMLLALPILSAFSRTSVLAALRFLPYARATGGLLKLRSPGAVARSGLAVLAVCVTLAVAALLPIPCAISLIALAGLWRLSWKRIGGCTGDVLGASIEIAEIVFLGTLAATGRLGAALGLFYPLARLVGAA